MGKYTQLICVVSLIECRSRRTSPRIGSHNTSQAARHHDRPCLPPPQIRPLTPLSLRPVTPRHFQGRAAHPHSAIMQPRPDPVSRPDGLVNRGLSVVFAAVLAGLPAELLRRGSTENTEMIATLHLTERSRIKHRSRSFRIMEICVFRKDKPQSTGALKWMSTRDRRLSPPIPQPHAHSARTRPGWVISPSPRHRMKHKLLISKAASLENGVLCQAFPRNGARCFESIY